MTAVCRRYSFLFFRSRLRLSLSVTALVSLLILDSVTTGVQHMYSRGPSDSPCICPYSCISTSECALRHSARGTEEVLFLCGEKGKICCPPLRDDCTGDTFTEGSNKFIETSTTTTTTTTTTLRVTKTPIPSPNKPSEPPKNYFHVPSGLYVHTDNLGVQQHNTPASGMKGNQYRRPSDSPGNLMKKPNSLTSHRNFRLLPSESECGGSHFANRITEGEEVSLGEYPWMVLTGVKDRYGNYRWNCGGTLINDWYVLTAAHCLVVDNRTIEYVRLGEHSLANVTDCHREVCLEPPEDIPVAEVIPHEKWNTTTIKNDIALIRLTRNPLRTGKSNIHPICLPKDIKKLNLTSTSKYEVAGWGKTDWNADEGSDVLRKATISGVSREECNICNEKKKQQYCPITDTQLCVQGWKAVDVCKGDSGGPLMVTRLNTYQIGITSFKGSEYCGAENIPSIFTKVDNYMNWILDNIRE